MAHQTIFVAGATGTQGGSVVRSLSARTPQPQIHVTVRNPSSTAAESLARLSNVKIFQGDFDNVSILTAAMAGCTAAFLNVTPVFTDLSAEARHAQNLVTAAETAGVQRVLYSSSSAMVRPLTDEVWTEYVANNPGKWMTVYMTSKRACEEAVQKSRVAEGWTILRAASFYTNYILPSSDFMYPNLRTTQTITTALDLNAKVACLDPEDIGGWVAKVLTMGKEKFETKYKGQAVPFAKGYWSTREIVDKLNAALGGEVVKLVSIPREEAKERAAKGDVVVDSQLWQNKYPVNFGLEEVRAFGIDTESMTGWEKFLETNKDKLLQSVGGRN